MPRRPARKEGVRAARAGGDGGSRAHDSSGPHATLPRMRWLIVLPFERPGHMGVDFAEELTALGHEVRTFAYRRENPLYKNKPTKALYTRVLLGRLQRIADEWRPQVVLVIKGGP